MKAVKFFTLILTACLSIVLNAPTAFAAAEQDPAELRIVGASEGDVFSAYRIIDIVWDKEKNTVSYSWSANFAGFFKYYNSDGKHISDHPENNVPIIPETFSQLADTNVYAFRNLLAEVKIWISRPEQNRLSPDYTSGRAALTDTSAAASFGKVTPGGYLVLSSSETEIYAPMFIAVEPEIVDGKYVLSPSTEFDIYAKHSSVWITKEISGASFSAGDVISYEIAVQKPVYPYGYEREQLLSIIDTLPDGVSLLSSSVKIYGAAGGTETELTAGTHYALDIYSESYFAVWITNQFYANLADYDTLIVRYDAELKTSGAKLGEENVNTAQFIYASDMGIGYGEQTASADFASYGILISKTDVSGLPLKGAEFELYRPATGSEILAGESVRLTVEDGEVDAVKIANAGAKYNVSNVASAGDEKAVSDLAGRAMFAYLAEGTYYVLETKAPTGYNMSELAVEITVSAENAGEHGYVSLTFTNSEGFHLPSTGGSGTLGLSILGILLMFAAVIMVAALLPRKEKDDRQK